MQLEYPGFYLFRENITWVRAGLEVPFGAVKCTQSGKAQSPLAFGKPLVCKSPPPGPGANAALRPSVRTVVS